MKSHKKELHNPAEETSDKHKTSLSPAVRNLVDSYGIDFFKLSGTGPHSRVLKGDVIKYMQKFNMKEKVWRKRKTGTAVNSCLYSVHQNSLKSCKERNNICNNVYVTVYYFKKITSLNHIVIVY